MNLVPEFPTLEFRIHQERGWAVDLDYPCDWTVMRLRNIEVDNHRPGSSVVFTKLDNNMTFHEIAVHYAGSVDVDQCIDDALPTKLVCSVPAY